MVQGSATMEKKGRRRRRRLLGVLVLLPLIGLGGYLAGTNLWAWHNYNAAQKALEIGDYREAEKALESCLTFWPGNGQVHFWMARTARCLGEYDRARRHLRRCEELHWSPEGIDLELTLLRAQQGEFAEVEPTVLEMADKDNPDAAAAMEVLAHYYTANRLLAPALFWGERFLKQAPKNAVALLLVARVNQLAHNSADAVKFYRRAMAVQPDNAPARQALAEALLEFNEPRDALVQYRELRSRGVQSREVRLGLAQCYRALGRGKEAEEILAALAHEDPESAVVWSERGKLALKGPDLARAERFLRKAARLSPYDYTTYYSLYLCLRQQGRSRRAEAARYHARYEKLRNDARRLDELVLRGLSEHPKDAATLYEVGRLLARLGQEKQGVYYYQQALRYQPNHQGARRALAAYQAKAGRRESPSPDY
jgi:tetratricopeptide (TPR) repeat protein